MHLYANEVVIGGDNQVLCVGATFLRNEANEERKVDNYLMLQVVDGNLTLESAITSVTQGVHWDTCIQKELMQILL